jgi:tripartite-type tricarboxylate transporter receptor subunit TctC
MLALVLAAMPAAAQTNGPEQWPAKAVKLVVGFTAGSATDVTARMFAQKFGEAWGQPVIVDNVTGNSGAIGVDKVAKSAPDGYTLMWTGNAAVTVLPALQPVPFDPLKDFAPISITLSMPSVIAVNNDLPVRTLGELIAYAKANPGKVSYGSTGAGSTNQLGAELFAAEAGGLKLLHVPYRGGAPAIADVATGQIDIFFANISEIVGQISSGQVRALGIASAVPNPMAPDLPLLTKDMPTVEINNWFGLVGPAGLPPDIATSLAKLFLDAINDPATKPLLDSRGLVAIPQDGPAFQAQIIKDRERWAKVVKQGNIRADNN